MDHKLLIVFGALLISFKLCAQVYHYQTGKVVPVSKPGQIVWRSGVFNGYNANFGTLLVKENSNNKKSRLIHIPVVQIPQIGTDTALTPLYILYGGPGESNFRPELIFFDILKKRSLVLVGYRGVDGSSKLDCNCLSNFLVNYNYSDTLFKKQYLATVNKCIDSLISQNIDINGYSIDEVANDIAMVANLLDHKKISLLAYSYGTMVAQQFNEKYAELSDKLLLLGARPIGEFGFYADIYEQQINKLVTEYLLNVFNNKLSKPVFDSIIFANTGFNPIKYQLFFFSKLYSNSGAFELFNAINNATNNNFKPIVNQYNLFYKTYPGSVVLFDMIIKKQGYGLKNHNNPANNYYSGITHFLNTWYNPLFCGLSKKSAVDSKLYSTKVLIINGQHDVASPPQLVEHLILPYYYNAEYKVIDKATHLELFFSSKAFVDSLIIDFFNKW